MYNDGLKGITENMPSSMLQQHLYSITKFPLFYFFSITICDGVIFLFQEGIYFKMQQVLLLSALHIESLCNFNSQS